MSLDRRQQQLVRDEFRAALSQIPVGADEIAGCLGWDADRLARTCDAAPGTDPVDVWELRDHLHVTLRAAGRRSPFTVLSSANRLRARLWFRLRAVPRAHRCDRR